MRMNLNASVRNKNTHILTSVIEMVCLDLNLDLNATPELFILLSVDSRTLERTSQWLSL